MIRLVSTIISEWSTEISYKFIKTGLINQLKQLLNGNALNISPLKDLYTAKFVFFMIGNLVIDNQLYWEIIVQDKELLEGIFNTLKGKWIISYSWNLMTNYNRNIFCWLKNWRGDCSIKYK